MLAPRMLAAVAVPVLLAGCGSEPTAPEPPAAPEQAEDGSEDGDDADDAEDPGGPDGAAADADRGVDDDEEAPVEEGVREGAPADAESEWDAHIVDWPTTRVRVLADDAEHELIARIAAEPSERQQGLMGVEHLPDDAGMLFAFPEDREGGFWMKDTLVPLDIAFAAADGTIVATEHMVPCEEDEDCPTYAPATAYRVALEVPGGWLEARGVEVGDRIAWDHLPAAH